MAYIPIDIDEAVKKECRRRRLSPRTLQTYLFCIRRFLNWSRKELGHISKKDVKAFLVHLSEKDRAGSTLNVYHMALRFLFVDVLEKRMWIDIKYSKVPKRLPVVLTKEETKKVQLVETPRKERCHTNGNHGTQTYRNQPHGDSTDAQNRQFS